MEINKDSQATLLLCSDIALRDGVRPFTAIQWYSIAKNLHDAGLSPKDLFSIESVSDRLGLNDDDTDRIKRLLDRGGQFGLVINTLNEKGIYTLTKSDRDYPNRLRTKLKQEAPPVLFYAGNLKLLNNDGVAIVGSRNIEQDALDFTKVLAEKCAGSGLNIVSGGARGVDSVAEITSFNMDGTSIIFMADSLERKIRKKETREAISHNNTLVMSAQRPDMPFKPYIAMGRNKYVYAMANYAVAVSSDADKGGTWTGAVEDLKKGWTPLFVRNGDEMPQGNVKLLDMDGVRPITMEDIERASDMKEWFDSRSIPAETKMNSEVLEKEPEGEQLSMFDVLTAV